MSLYFLQNFFLPVLGKGHAWSHRKRYMKLACEIKPFIALEHEVAVQSHTTLEGGTCWGFGYLASTGL